MRASFGVATIAALVGLTTARVGRADRSRVVLVREASADAAVDRAEVRVAAELRASGFEVQEVSVEADEDARNVVEGRGDAAPFATVLLRHAGHGTTTDVWVADRVTRKTVVRRIESRGSGDSADRALALGVVELMRASLVEGLVMTPTAEQPPASLPPDVVRWTREAVHQPPLARPFGLGLSVGVAGAFAGPDLGMAAAPQVRLALHVSRTLSVGVTGVGPAFGARVVRSEGAGSVRQELALAEATFEPSTRGLLSASLSIGAGAYHVDVSGDAAPSYVNGHSDAWSALGSAGGGARARLSSDVSIALDFRALVALPRPVIVFGTERVAAAMQPGALGGFSLSVDL
jgi:hypothetical protein